MKHLLSILAFSVAFIASASAQSRASLTTGRFLTPSEVSEFLKTPEARFAGLIKDPPPSTHIGVIRFAPGALSAAEVEIDLPDGKHAVFLTTAFPTTIEPHSGARAWAGRRKDEVIDGRPRQLARIALVPRPNAQDAIGGHLNLEDDTYEITTVSDDMVAIFKYDRNAPRKQHPDGWHEFQERVKSSRRPSGSSP